MIETTTKSTLSFHKLSDQNLSPHWGTVALMSVAIAIITILGFSGVLPSNEPALIMGGITLGCYGIYLLSLRKIMQHCPDQFPTSGKVFLALETISILTFCILGMTGTLSPQTMGLGILATYGLSYSMGPIRVAFANPDVRKSLHFLIPIALTALNFLGSFWVTGGSDASLVLGVTNGAALLLFTAIHFFRNRDALPTYDAVMLPLMLITAIGLGALGFLGVPPVTIGTAAICAIGTSFVSANFLNNFCMRTESRQPTKKVVA